MLKKYLILWGCMLSCFSHVWLFATLWTVVRQAPLSMGLSRVEYWGGLPCPPPRDLPNPGIEPESPVSPTLAGGFFTTSVLGNLIKFEILNIYYFLLYILKTKEVVTMRIGKLFWLVVISNYSGKIHSGKYEIHSGKYDSGRQTIL